MKIGLYGGSFNPVHYGHVRVAESAIAELGLDRLIVLPAAVSPFKSEVKTIFDRIARVRAAFAGMAKTTVDLREVERGGVSYAIETVREIARENQGAELFFIIGEDSVEGLPRWKDIEELKTLCTFKAYPRTKESSSEIRELFEAGKVVENPDEKLRAAVEEGVLRKNGFCPCRLQKTPENFCPCDEFKAQLRDAEYHGFCHCRLYLKP